MKRIALLLLLLLPVLLPVVPASAGDEAVPPDWLHFRPGVMHQPGCLVCAPRGPAQATDTDGDGMPDDFELRHRLNPRLRDDAGEDPDRDGFSNYEEYKSRTDPRDPARHPAWWTRLRVTDARLEPVELTLVAINREGPRVQLRINQQSYAGDAGAWFQGIAIQEQHPDRVILRAHRQAVTLQPGETLRLVQPRITLSLDEATLQVYPSGDPLNLHGEAYVTHQLSRDGLLIRDPATRANISFLVPAKSGEALRRINRLFQE